MDNREAHYIPLHAQITQIRKKRLLELLPISSSTLYRLIATGKFPKQRRIGERVSIWSLAEVELWLKQREGGQS